MSHAYVIRSHHKSRKGCTSCKLRRVKCDEAKPQCSHCVRRSSECIYLGNTLSKEDARSSTSGSPLEPDKHGEIQSTACFQNSSSSSHYSTKHLLDLRLMHHYHVSTAQYFARTYPEDVLIGLKIHMPQLAFEHAFVLDALLLVSMVHMGCTDPTSLDSLPVYSYRDQALRTLRQAVADNSPKTLDAVRGASVLLATVSLAADRLTSQTGLWTLGWLTLAIGQRNFRIPSPFQKPSASLSKQDNMAFPSDVYGCFTDLPTPGIIPVDIQRALSKVKDDINPEDGKVLRQAAEELGRLISILRHPYEELWLEKQIKAWAFDVIPAQFQVLIRQAHPPALIILAYYLVLFKFLPNTWTYQGVADHDVQEICTMIDSAWVEFMSLPTVALRVEDNASLSNLLVRCLPGSGEDVQGQGQSLQNGQTLPEID